MRWKNVGLVRAWKKKGISVRKIAEKTGCTVNRVYYLLRKKEKKKKRAKEHAAVNEHEGIRLLARTRGTSYPRKDGVQNN